MAKSKWTIFLVLFLLSSIIIFFNHSRPVSYLRSYLNKILMPLEIAFSRTGNGFLFWQNTLFNIKNIKKLNTELTLENLELYGKLVKLSQLEKENTLLREKLNLASENSWNTDLAEVIGRDFENRRSFLINKGSNDGIAIGMPVILSGRTVIGRISEINSTSSKVKTVIDVESKIMAIILNKEIAGLVRGLGSDVILDLIAKNKKPEAGDLIISSGADGLWPRGLIIGKVKEVKSEDSQFFNTADIELLTDFRDFNDVFIITNSLSKQ